MKTIQTSIIIEALRERIWEVLMDFDAHPDWNPMIHHIQGTQQEGAQLDVKLGSKEKPMHFKPTVKELKTNETFAWEGSLPLGSFIGKHYFKLEYMTEHSTKFIHGEEFRGWLLWALWPLVGERTKAHFEAMNKALKKRCEAMD